MVTKNEAIQELGRRGELPPEQQSAYDELSRRGEFTQTVKDASPLNVAVDVATTIGTGIAGFGAELGGRLVGLPFGVDKSLEFGEAAREAIATEPTTRGGEVVLEKLGGLIEEFKGLVDLAGAGVAGGAELISGGGIDAAADEIRRVRELGLSQAIGENIFEATGSPVLAAGFQALPETALLATGGLKTPSKLQGKVRASRPSVTVPVGAKPSADKLTGSLAKDVRVSSRGLLPRDKAASIGATAKVDVAAAKAFDELGIKPTPELIATDAEFINLVRSVEERIGSTLSKEKARVIQELSTKADELVTSVGGKTDRSAVASSAEAEFKATIDGLKGVEAELWKPIREIPGSTTLRASDDLVGYVDLRLADAKGNRAKLSPMDKEIFDLVYEKVPVRDSITLKSGKPSTKIRRDANGKIVYENILVDTTNALLNRTRSKIGRNYSKQDTIYPDSNSAAIGEAYGVLAKEHAKNIPPALADDFKLANTLTVQRKALEESSINLLGKELEKGLIPKIDSAASAVAKGDVKPLRNLLREAPQGSRAEITAGVLDSLIKTPGREIKGSFVDRFNGVIANKEAMNELFRNFPPEARKVFENIGVVSKRLINNPAVIDSSVVRTAIANGAVAKVIHSTRSIPFGGRIIQGTTINLTKVFTSPEKSLKAADAFLSSPEFINAIKAQAAGNASRANKIVGSSVKYQKWLANLDSTLRSRIVKTGFVTWLISEDN